MKKITSLFLIFIFSFFVSPFFTFAKNPIPTDFTQEKVSDLYSVSPYSDDGVTTVYEPRIPTNTKTYTAVTKSHQFELINIEDITPQTNTISSGTPFSGTGNPVYIYTNQNTTSSHIAQANNGYDTNMGTYVSGMYTNGITVNSAFGDESPVKKRTIRRTSTSATQDENVIYTSNERYSDFNELTNAPKTAFTKSQNAYGANVLGTNFSFLPQTALGWVGLMILALFFVFFLRYIVQIFKK